MGEAENAIRGINDDKTLGLKARFAQRSNKIYDPIKNLAIYPATNDEFLQIVPRTSQYECYVSPINNWNNLPRTSAVCNIFQDDVSSNNQNKKIKYVGGRAVFQESKEIIFNMQNLSAKSDGKFDSNSVTL